MGKKNCLVIGGGILGLSVAYYLHKDGHQVTVIDKSEMADGASYVNAGYLTPSHIIPIAAPGVMRKGLKWMFNPASPLFIKPSLNPDFLKWTMAFNKSCNAEHVARSAPAIRDINLLSQELYADIKEDENFSFQLEKKGLLMLCNTASTLEEESKVAQMAVAEGLPAKVLTAAEVKNMMPDANMKIEGATYYACDNHTTPHEFMTEMKSYLERNGVQILKNTEVTEIKTVRGTITGLMTGKDFHGCDEVVLCAGSWSAILAKKIGLRLLLQAGKGYSINKKEATGISVPSILAEAKVAITPMNGFTRFAGTMEIAGQNENISRMRVEAIAGAVQRYFPKVEVSREERNNATCGLRPVSPDGMPYIGRSAKCSNLTIATGHAMMGWSLGPATGLLVSEIIGNRRTSLNLDLYHPDRKF
ncbi:MAG: FAD-dependent oxidoreductase [Leeuwenhoekiella sp.]